MSSKSIISQGLQSCFEPLILEPHAIIHQLVPSKQSENHFAENKTHCPIETNYETNKNSQKPTWNFMQTLTSNSFNHKQLANDLEPIYVHPLAKSSTFSMSSKSLEMCTEGLGCETGSNCFRSSVDEFSYLELEKQSNNRVKPTKLFKKVKNNSNFPPPLTSISGNKGVKMQRQYEGGRLVIKAVKLSSCRNYFKAERENGRLRVFMLREDNDKWAENEEKVEDENIHEVKKVGCRIKGGDWSNGRCKGDGNKRLQSLPFCVAIS